MTSWSEAAGGWRRHLYEVSEGFHYAHGRTRQAALAALSHIADLERQLKTYEERRTTGGPAPEADETWANRTAPPPESASDPTAPPLRREGYDQHNRKDDQNDQ